MALAAGDAESAPPAPFVSCTSQLLPWSIVKRANPPSDDDSTFASRKGIGVAVCPLAAVQDGF
jgi:hypothetical protein